MSSAIEDVRPASVETVRVDLGARSYDVMIGRSLIAQAGSLVERTGLKRAIVVSDEAVARHHLAALRAALGPIVQAEHIVPQGEASKSWEHVIGLVDAILDAGLERGDGIIALGGGVVGDLAGFAAAIARRGMPFVQIPTSLLAQVDSAVGGKTGINTRHGKNLVGAFHQPELVLADIDALDTLPERERRAGYAEIVKMALIRDAAFFERLDGLARPAHEKIAASIATAVAGKADVVAADERESDQRALLNLGHTFAHAVERIAGYDGRVVHGEAVGLGLCLAFRFSHTLGLAPAGDAERVAAHVARVGLPTCFDDIAVEMTAPALIEAMAQDKKVKDGVIRFILVRGIGSAFVSDGVPPDALAAFLAAEGVPS